MHWFSSTSIRPELFGLPLIAKMINSQYILVYWASGFYNYNTHLPVRPELIKKLAVVEDEALQLSSPPVQTKGLYDLDNNSF